MSRLGQEDWEQVDRLFQAVLALPEDAQANFLEACGESSEVVDRVRRLLQAGGDAQARIGESADDLAAGVMAASDNESLGEFPSGSEIGPYRIRREIGRGGMGTVYLAERSDDQYDRLVALKVVKRGMDTAEVLERFNREGRILARLEHPGIGRMYDAGATSDGRPYLVLEYIEGRPINEFCDLGRLTLNERIKLFVGVCDAVAFAHQKLVLHRDIKPSNILVSDGGPRLLDFGISKILDEEAPETQPLTELAGQRLTPEYASPEQRAGVEITTASDVYSLGVVLYELLTGSRPEPDSVRRPSAVLTDLDRGQETNDLATARGSTRQRLVKGLQGDLDVILMKALHPDVDRRYPSVEGFAEDLRRFTNGFPVTARPDSVGYRVGKFVRRNRWPVVSGSGLGAAVVIFSVASAFQQAQTKRERDRAELESARAGQVAGVLEGLFTGAGFDSRERIDTLTVRAFLDLRADEILTQLDEQPAVRGTLLRILGSAQREFGELSRADSLLSSSIATLAALGESDPKALLDAKEELARLRTRQGRHEEAKALYDEWFAADIEPTPEERAGAFHNLGLAFIDAGQYDSAAAMFDTALVVHRRDPEMNRAGYATTLSMRAGAAQRMGDLSLALEASKEAWDILSVELGDGHPQVFALEHNYAFMLHRSGSSAEAEPIFANMVTRYRAEIGENLNFASLLLNHGNVLRELGRTDSALAAIREATDLTIRMQGPNNPNLTPFYDALGVTYEAMDRNQEALEAFRAGLELSEQGLGPDHPFTAATRSRVASATCAVTHESGGAIRQDFSTAEDELARAFPPDHPAQTDHQIRWGRCLLLLGERDEARQVLESVLERVESQGGPASAVEQIGELLEQAGRNPA